MGAQDTESVLGTRQRGLRDRTGAAPLLMRASLPSPPLFPCSTRERVEWVGDATINIYNCTRTAFATLDGEGGEGGVTYGDHRLLHGVLRRAALSGRAPSSADMPAKTTQRGEQRGGASGVADAWSR